MKLPVIIDVYSHYFKVNISGDQFPIISDFARSKIHWSSFKQRGRWIREVKAVFASQSKDLKEMRYHINDLNAFIQYLNSRNIKTSDVVITKHDPSEIKWPVFNNELKPHFVLRPTQEQAIDFCTDYDQDRRIKLVELNTGEGKSLVSMEVANRLHSRFVMIVRPQYIEKWEEDLVNSMLIKKDEIEVVQGSPSLKKLLKNIKKKSMAKSVKAILISNRTMQSYIKLYELLRDDIKSEGWVITPDELCEHLGARVLLIDEGHQDFHLNFKLMLFTHTELTVTTTATLTFDDRFLSNVANNVFDRESRFNPNTVNNYIHCNAMMYNFKQPRYIRCMSSKGYSHIEFEKSVMRHVPTKNAYFGMIFNIIKDECLNGVFDKHPHFKAIVFCATIKMCSELTEYLKRKIEGMDIRRYIGDDPYENLVEARIIVTTPGSAGTAVDVPGLYLNIMTVALSSTQANRQCIGRLRAMKCKTNPVFYYLVCRDIAKHMDYHADKPEIFARVSKSFRELNYRYEI